MARIPVTPQPDRPRVDVPMSPAPPRSMADLPPSTGYLQGEIERLPVAGAILGDEEFPILQSGQAKRGSTRSLLKRIREEANDVAKNAAKLAIDGGGSGRHSLVRSVNRARALVSLDGSETVGIVREGEFFRVPVSLLSGGGGGGGDATTLGGQLPAYYLDWANFTGVPTTFTPSAHTHAQSEVTNLVADLAAKAPLASPALTGNPTAPTQAAGNNSTSLATTAYTDQAIAALVASAPGVLDTLDEIAAALGDDPNFATTITTALADKLAKSSNLSDLTNAATARGNLGLGNVDNTSDATKNSAVAALTNKDLTSGTNTFPTFNQNTTGSAAKLTTARNIDGQAFDGTANITVIAPGTHAATGKTTPVDADEIALVDSAASNVLKKLTWANLKAALKAYFDTLYSPLGSSLPSFSAHKNGTNQTGITNGVDTKVTFGTTDFNTGSLWDTTNSKWTPPAGRVTITAQIYVTGTFSGSTGSATVCAIWKNGAVLKEGFFYGALANNGNATVTVIDSASGTDYYEVYVRQAGTGGATIDGTAKWTYVTGAVI